MKPETVKDDRYARAAERWSATQYADARAYLEHRARLVDELGAPLERGAYATDRPAFFRRAASTPNGSSSST